MSDYIANLEASLRAAAAREYPAREGSAESVSRDVIDSRVRPIWWRVRSRWWRSPVVVLLVVLAGGSTAAAVALLSRSSAPLTGSVPGLAGRLRYDVPLTPDLEPGNAGWCSYPIFAVTGTIEDAGGGTCSPAVPPGTPAILAGGEPISNEQALLRDAHLPLSARQRRLNLFWMVVSSRVAAVRLDANEVVASRPDPRLPRGWRAVVAFTSVPLSRPVLLDRYGHAIASRGAARAARSRDLEAYRLFVPIFRDQARRRRARSAGCVWPA